MLVIAEIDDQSTDFLSAIFSAIFSRYHWLQPEEQDRHSDVFVVLPTSSHGQNKGEQELLIFNKSNPIDYIHKRVVLTHRRWSLNTRCVP